MKYWNHRYVNLFFACASLLFVFVDSMLGQWGWVVFWVVSGLLHRYLYAVKCEEIEKERKENETTK